MKTALLHILTAFFCAFIFLPLASTAQVQPLGKVIGNQTVTAVPIAPPGYAMAQALVYYPDDYFLPANANKKYPLYIFLHGAGEGSTNNITQVLNTSVPQLISQGLKPYGIDPVTKDTIKFIVVSPHAANTGSSYSYPQLQYTIPYLFTALHVDTSCVWVGGLSAGARGTWSVVMGGKVGDTALGKRITGIMPMANGGYDNMLASMQPNLDTIARRGLGCLYTIGDQDPGYNSIGFFAYQAIMKKYSQPGKYHDSVVIGGTHSANVWNPPFPETARVWSKTMNAWTQMWTMRKTAVTVTAPPPTPVPPTVSAGNTQTMTLPASTATLTGTATSASGTTITGYAWSKTSGPAATITSPSSASTTVTGLTAGTYLFSLKVTASNGLTTTGTVQITANPAPNTAPSANAGANQTITLPTNTVTLTGSGTDAEGPIATYAWSETSGPVATISNPSSASTAVTGLAAGTYLFKLTVTDGQGSTASGTVQVTVNAAPIVTPPVVTTPPPVTTTPTSTGKFVTKVGCTEYKSAFLYSDSVVRSFVYNPISGHVEFMPFLINNRKAVDISTGFNVITILDDQGYVWLGDAGKNSATRWNTDATGAAFNGNASIYGYFYTYLSIRNDGSIWYWGGDDYKFYGGTAISQPVKLNQPAGVKFVKLAMGSSLLGLTATGDVYQWNKGSVNYVKVNLPRPASDIAASHMNFFVAVVPDDIATSTMGYPYAWGSESKYWGGDGSSYTPGAPVSIKALWQMSVPIKKITANHNVIHYIDANGDLYGIGDNPNGEIGNGQELVNHAEKYPTPYAWSWTKYEALTGAPAIHVATGTKFKEIYTGSAFAFYHYALDTNDSLYFWGRNKSFVGGDGVVNNQEVTYPNALDVLTPTMRTPLGVSATQTAGYNFTKYTLKADPQQTILTTSATLSATATPTVLVSSSHPNYGYSIQKYQWTKVSGPACTIASPNAATSNVTGMATGTYVFSIQTTDNNTATITAYDTIVVNAPVVVAPVVIFAVNSGADTTITLPANSVTLNGVATVQNDTIVRIKWSQISGPTTATITGDGTMTPTMSNLAQGAYVFKVDMNSKSGKAATDGMKVTVMASATTATTATTTTASAVSVSENIGKAVTMKAYPNPVAMDQQITIEGNSSKEGTVKFMMYDLGGRLVKQLTRENQFPSFRQTISLAGLGRGAYILTMQSGGNTKPEVFKFVIQ